MITLVDMGAVFWRNYFATKSDIDAYELTVDKVREHHDASDRVVICCDAPPFLRCIEYPQYKANREEKPREALDSLRAAEQQFESWGLPVIKITGYEADDVIAELVRQADEPVRILSHDKDLYQLIRDDVVMVKSDGRIIDAFETRKKFGVEPGQMLDYLTLVGDASDNVPGCPSVGPGRARDLLQRFRTLDGIMAATDEELNEVRGVGEKTLASIRSWDPTLARSLITLAPNVPVWLRELWSTPAPVVSEEFTIQW